MWEGLMRVTMVFERRVFLFSSQLVVTWEAIYVRAMAIHLSILLRRGRGRGRP